MRTFLLDTKEELDYYRLQWMKVGSISSTEDCQWHTLTCYNTTNVELLGTENILYCGWLSKLPHAMFASAITHSALEPGFIANSISVSYSYNI